MPWNYRRRYYKDGHMVIKEFKLDHHDYFQVGRENKQLSLQKVYVDKESHVNQENEAPTHGKQSLAHQKMDKEKMTVVVDIETMVEESPSPPTQSSSDSGSSSSSSSDSTSSSTSFPSDIEEEESWTDEEDKCMDSEKVLLELQQPFRREMVEDETSTPVLAPLTSAPPSPKPAFPELCDEAYAIENSILFKGQLLA
ncbi:hypothetical protein COCNU_contig69454976G000010 [Cocos nucifera]|nr:hypothetical protein [Cocos nucifera]